jgi:hypothetical protein
MAGYIGSKASVVSSGVEHKKTFTITGATTSLTGLNYTVGKVHVFQNGVRLVDGTDYTATNSTTITLTVAAQSGDNVVVISQADFQVSGAVSTSGGTMTGDLTVQGAFTSQGIDDNADAVAMTITSDETVLIGKNTTAIGTAGHRINGLGYHYATRAMGSNGTDPVFIANILNNDGNAIEIYKDSNKVGSIGTNGSDLYIGSTDSLHGGVTFAQRAMLPNLNGVTPNDGGTDLGGSSNRWRDAYLSGGIYLGGVGSANKLDDYEEGTWNPLITGSGNSIVSGTAVGRYVKIGETVFVWMTLNNNGSNTFGSSVITFSGLPFTSQSSSSGNPVPLTTPVFYRFVTPPSGANQLVTYISGTYNHLELYWSSSGNWQQFTGSHINNDASFALYFGAIYRTNS